MKVLEFMNSHSDWEELLTGAPYNLMIKRDGDYIMLSYSQINSDFNEQICREAPSLDMMVISGFVFVERWISLQIMGNPMLRRLIGTLPLCLKRLMVL